MFNCKDLRALVNSLFRNLFQKLSTIGVSVKRSVIINVAGNITVGDCRWATSSEGIPIFSRDLSMEVHEVSHMHQLKRTRNSLIMDPNKTYIPFL